MRTILTFALSFFIFACTTSKENNSTENEIVHIAQQEEVQTEDIPQNEPLIELSKQILQAIKENNWTEFSSFIHPEKGVRFSPYAYVDTSENIVLKAIGINAMTRKHLWGYYDGSGEEIQLSVEEYFNEFVYDVDFLHPEQMKEDTIIRTGNSLNNLTEIYANHHFVNCYFSGFDPTYEGMDWRSLRLVFEEFEGRTVLIALIHDQWTI